MPYNAFTGFPLSLEDILNKVAWISLLMTLIFIAYLSRNRKYKRLLSISTVVAITLFSLHIKDFNNENTESNHHERFSNELNYYAEKQEESPYTSLDYEIKKYVIDLKTSDIVEAKVDIYFDYKIKGKKSFALYHGFKVLKIIDEHGNRLNYKQKGDFIIVEAEKSTKKISFTYSGESSPYIPVSENGVYLPFHFAWLPSKTSNASFKYIFESNHRLPQQPKKQIEYILYYKGSSINTNLKGHKDYYRGISDNGIYVISGEMKTIMWKNTKISYPLTWENSMENLDNYLLKLTNIFEMANNNFELNLSIPKNISFVPVRGANDNHVSEYMWFHPNEIFIMVDPYENHDKMLLNILEKRIAYDIVGSLTWKREGIVYEDYNIVTLFNIMLGMQFNKTLGIDEGDNSIGTFSLSELSRLLNDESEKMIMDEIIGFVDTSKDEDINTFFDEWRINLINEEINWFDVKNILDKVKAEMKEEKS